MARCKWCGRSGLFLSINEISVCNNCWAIISPEFFAGKKIILESLQLVVNSKNLDTKLFRLDLALEWAEKLIKYENKGISVISPPPSEFLTTLPPERNRIIKEALEFEIKELKVKVDVATSSQSQISHLSKFLLRIHDYKDKLKDPSLLDDLEQEVIKSISKIKLESFSTGSKES